MKEKKKVKKEEEHQHQWVKVDTEYKWAGIGWRPHYVFMCPICSKTITR